MKTPRLLKKRTPKTNSQPSTEYSTIVTDPQDHIGKELTAAFRDDPHETLIAANKEGEIERALQEANYRDTENYVPIRSTGASGILGALNEYKKIKGTKKDPEIKRRTAKFATEQTQRILDRNAKTARITETIKKIKDGVGGRKTRRRYNKTRKTVRRHRRTHRRR